MLFNTWIPLRNNNYITAYVFLYQQAGYRIHRLTGMVVYYPPGSKCEALRLGVHLILLYFIRILVVGTEIIFLFCGCGCGCGCGGVMACDISPMAMFYIRFLSGVFFCFQSSFFVQLCLAFSFSLFRNGGFANLNIQLLENKTTAK